MRTRRFVLAGLVVVILALSGLAARALADGDPASDFLVGDDAYLPFPVPSRQASAPLLAQVDSVYTAGYRIKVAVIATSTDLGSISSLIGHPTTYAHFLGVELSSFYLGPLLIVMQAGFGIYDGGGSTAAELRILKGIHVRGSGADDLTRAATSAVSMLLKAGALKSRDRLGPLAYPASSIGRLGQPMKLGYTVVENSERSSVVVTVLAASVPIATFRVPLQRVMPKTTYSVTWNVPTTLPAGPYTMCVSGRDASGNEGQKSCMGIQIT